MSGTVSAASERIVLQLDVAIAFEGLILNRLERISKAGKQPWLRGLLVRGFLSECRALRELQHTDQSVGDVPQPGTTRQTPVNHPRSETPQETNPQTEPVVASEQPAGNPVSFGALRKVIG